VQPTPLQRALAEAPEKARAQAARPDEEFFVFRLGELTLAVLSGQVREVARLSPMTPLPRAPSFLLGVVGNRGQVIPVVDLLRFLQQGESKVVRGARIFVGESNSLLVAFLADTVIGLRRIFVADQLPPPSGGGAASEFLTGVVQHRELGTLSLLDLSRVLQNARGAVVRR
jgi:purine-binding chemotaxis protein CheW